VPDDLDDRGGEIMESMTNIQAVTTQHKPAAQQRMYRGILTAAAICDCFVRATSDTDANAAMKAGKGQKAKPRFGKWKLWQEAIAVDGYTASQVPAQEIPNPGLTEQELGQIYMAVQHNISVIRGVGVHTDKERQAMAVAVREFHNLLKTAIRAKAAQ
jgi:hypothetical protein